MYDLIIIGGGPAGLSAAVYAARKKISTLLLSEDIGGQVNWTTGVENYLGYQFIEGKDLITKFQEQVNQFPIEQKIGEKVSGIIKSGDGFEVTTGSGQKYATKTLVIATGKRPRRLNVPGETEFTGRGVTYCAICDGPIFADRQVAVVGGGNSAVGAALDMTKIASRVDLISITPLTADPVLVEKLNKTANVTVHVEHTVREISGEGLVDSLSFTDNKTGEVKKLDVTGVFIEIGLIPNTDLTQGLVKLNESGEIPVNCSSETGVRGLFAAGDVTDVPSKQIVIAAGEGAKAALAAHRLLQMTA